MEEVRAVKKNVAQVQLNNYAGRWPNRRKDPAWSLIIVDGTPTWQKIKVNV